MPSQIGLGISGTKTNHIKFFQVKLSPCWLGSKSSWVKVGSHPIELH